jgi:hypothetical protein
LMLLLLLLLLLLFLFFLKLIFNIASFRTWFSVLAIIVSPMASSLSLILSHPLLNTYNSLPYLDSFLWFSTVAETKVHEDTSFFHSDSKTSTVLCDNCIKFQLFVGAQDIFSRLMAVCCMVLPHNPYRLPQH